MRVPESITNGMLPHLEHITYSLSYHVMALSVCSVSRRSFAVAGARSPSPTQEADIAHQLVGQLDAPQPPAKLKTGLPTLLGRVVDATTRRAVGRHSEPRTM